MSFPEGRQGSRWDFLPFPFQVPTTLTVPNSISNLLSRWPQGSVFWGLTQGDKRLSAGWLLHPHLSLPPPAGLNIFSNLAPSERPNEDRTSSYIPTDPAVPFSSQDSRLKPPHVTECYPERKNGSQHHHLFVWLNKETLEQPIFLSNLHKLQFISQCIILNGWMTLGSKETK